MPNIGYSIQHCVIISITIKKNKHICNKKTQKCIYTMCVSKMENQKYDNLPKH